MAEALRRLSAWRSARRLRREYLWRACANALRAEFWLDHQHYLWKHEHLMLSNIKLDEIRQKIFKESK